MRNASELWANDIELTPQEKWDMIRDERTALLFRCDWTQLADAPLTIEEKQAWAAYRQALRNIPNDFSSADDAVFPDMPGAL
jgi:hypothetical protein